MQLLSGTNIRDERIPLLKAKAGTFVTPPTLAIVQIGERADSTSYIASKKKFAANIGVTIRHIQLPVTTTTHEVIAHIDALNTDATVTGIIIQLPVPLAIDKDTILNTILPHKDVDGLGAVNTAKLVEGRVDAILPATTRGILDLLDYYNIPIDGKKITIVGRSALVGKPTALACIARGAIVTVCHSKTVDLAVETKAADILIVAVGKPRLITAEHVSKDQTVIDVGITADQHRLGGVVGDVDATAVAPIIKALTPVPGGVGPMTILSLFSNLLML